MSLYDKHSTNINNNLASLLDTSNYTPALSNIYEVSILAGDSRGEASAASNRLQHFASFHATEVSINGESISFERHPVTKTFYLGSSSISQAPYTRVDEISITWRESNDWFIKRYHEAWVGMFYDKNTDTFKSIEKEDDSFKLYRTFRITLPHADANGNHLILVVNNVLPTATGDISLSWSNSPSLVTHKMTYKAENIYWECDSKPVVLDLNKTIAGN